MCTFACFLRICTHLLRILSKHKTEQQWTLAAHNDHKSQGKTGLDTSIYVKTGPEKTATLESKWVEIVYAHKQGLSRSGLKEQLHFHRHM